MFFKKKKQEPANSKESVENKSDKVSSEKYSVSGNFPHVLLSYVLILFLGLLVFQSFSVNSKHTHLTEKLYKHVAIQEERIQYLESNTNESVPKENNDTNKNDKEKDNTIINNYYYGQSPFSQHQPGNQTNMN